MATSPFKTLLYLFTLLSFLFFFTIHARLILHRSDYRAISIFQKYFGIVNGRCLSSTNPGDNPGVFGKSTRMNSNSYSDKPPHRATTNVKKYGKKNTKKNVVVLIPIFLIKTMESGLFLFVLFVLYRLVTTATKDKGRDSGRPAIFSPLIKKTEDLAFLETKDVFSSMELIGSGGCGKVFKAELPGSDGKMIAIKKVFQPLKYAAELTARNNQLLNRKMRQIRVEIKTVGEIRHRNLLPSLAHLSLADCHLLVFEFMENGSLQQVLIEISRGTRKLDWLIRHKIALGVAAELEYIHMSHDPPIIHRDLKPPNVLLNDDMEAKILDFGLAKGMSNAYTHISTSVLTGTVGYMAPEYYQTLQFTDKYDIFSFGVLLAVLVMGKQPSDDFFQHEQTSLIRWMRHVMASENPQKALDEKLVGNGFEEHMFFVLRIACFYTCEI